MSLRRSYAAFLDAPSKNALAEYATLHYVSTLTSLNDAPTIIKHLSVQEKLLKKKSQKILDAIEGANGLSVDVETTIEFVNGGGAYLPGLDDNFVADRTVTFPMVHVVHFDNAGKITQIRQYWDQGSLLKQIDVIGSRSRNWPIRDGKDQSNLIATASSAFGQPESASVSRPSTAASRGADDVSISSRSRGSTNNAMNDPHASLSLFQPRSITEEEHNVSVPIAPRAQSAKPPPREYSELFVGEHKGSPSPNEKIPVKAGAGRNYKQSRLFDEETEEERIAATPMSIRTNAKKYNHFEFGDGEDTPVVRDTARSRTKGKSEPNWDFESFATPNKAEPKTQPAAVRHFGWSDDEETSPVRRPIVHKARPDADPHFEFVDDGTPEAKRKQASTKGRTANKGQGLYEDHVTNTTDDAKDGAVRGDNKRALNDIKNAGNSEYRSKDFGAHFEMADNSPSVGKNGSKQPDQESRSHMKTHWGTHQDSPGERGISIAGNGMGNRSGTQFSLFDDEESPAKKETAKSAAVKSRNTGQQENEAPQGRGITIAGNGMGNRKGTQFSLFDEESPAKPTKNTTGGGGRDNSKSFDWDF
ncbi:hypothetical protein ACN47E_002874 [Coniothyrium glycines]